MPWYDFRCQECKTVFEEKRSFSRAQDPATCPNCYSRATQKLFAAAHLAGSQTEQSVPVPMMRKGAGGCGCGSCACNV